MKGFKRGICICAQSITNSLYAENGAEMEKTMEWNQELVSIITPMYNAGRYIGEAIESVQRQTYPNWEMIIMDDLSDDGSAEIVQEYAKADGRIRYFRETVKSGVAKGRNDAMKLAGGRYLAFLDSDDLWKPKKLEKQLSFLKNRRCAFTYAACDVVDENSVATSKVRHVPPKITYEKLLWGNVIPCLTVLLDREFVGEFSMPEIGHEDYAAWLTIFRKIPAAYGIDEILGSYRINNQSVSANKLRTIGWTWNIYRRNQKLPAYKSFFYLIGHLTQAMRKR